MIILSTVPPIDPEVLAQYYRENNLPPANQLEPSVPIKVLEPEQPTP